MNVALLKSYFSTSLNFISSLYIAKYSKDISWDHYMQIVSYLSITMSIMYRSNVTYLKSLAVLSTLKNNSENYFKLLKIVHRVDKHVPPHLGGCNR